MPFALFEREAGYEEARMRDETHDTESNALAAVRWAEREFATTNLIRGRDEERGGYSIIVRTSDDPLLSLNQLVIVTFLDARPLADQQHDEMGRILSACRRNDTGATRGSAMIHST